jgi:hypothetical protein
MKLKRVLVLTFVGGLSVSFLIGMLLFPNPKPNFIVCSGPAPGAITRFAWELYVTPQGELVDSDGHLITVDYLEPSLAEPAVDDEIHYIVLQTYDGANTPTTTVSAVVDKMRLMAHPSRKTVVYLPGKKAWWFSKLLP